MIAQLGKIMIVDDSPTVLKYFQMIIEQFFGKDNSVDYIGSGTEAIKLMADSHYDKIISDYKLKEGNGLDVLKKAKETGVKDRILITAVSKPIQLSDDVTYAQRKPITITDVLNMLETGKNDLAHSMEF